MSQKSKLKLTEPGYHLSFPSFHHYSSQPLSPWAHLLLIAPAILFFRHPTIAPATFHCLLLSIPSLTGCTSPGGSYSFSFLFWNLFIEVWLTQPKLTYLMYKTQCIGRLVYTGDAGDTGSIPGSGRSPGEGHGNPLQYSFLENHLDREAWWAIVHGVANNWTRLSS